MTLATHIMVAGAITKPFLGRLSWPFIFVISALSHYLSDAIPHYDYKLLSITWSEEHPKSHNIDLKLHLIAVDLLNIAIDVAIGSAFLLILARPELNLHNIITYGLIILGGILPDALQPVFILWKKFPMDIVQEMHDFWHSKLRLHLNRTAIASQGLLFIIAAFLISN